jgi:uncharacterized protein (TIGR00369 family)
LITVPPDPAYEARVRDSFDRQEIMSTLGASLAYVRPGEVGIDLPVHEGLGQQNGFVHAGVIATIADSACGYAALSLAPPGMDILSIEFKVNLLSPATGERLQARSRVVRAGRMITVCMADVFGLTGDEEKLVATMTATMISVPTPS